MNTQNVTRSIIVLLILAALVLGYFTYQKLVSAPEGTKAQQQTSPQFQIQNLGSLESQVLTDDSISDLERIVFGSEEPTTEGEYLTRDNAIGLLSKKVDVLDITDGCTFEPRILKVKIGESLTFRNLDVVEHFIRARVYDPETAEVSIPAGESRDIIVSDFVGLAGLEEASEAFSGFVCDQAASRVEGAFHIVP